MICSVETIADRVRRLREARGWDQSELARRVSSIASRKVAAQSIQQLEAGDVSRPRYLPELATALGTSLEYLLTGEGPSQLPNAKELPLTLPRKIPIINYIQAGHPKEVVDDYMAGAGMGEVSLYGEAAERYSRYTFALEVDGDSMLPEFRPGDVVIVDPDVVPNPGNIVVAKLDTEDRATLKKYRARGFDAQGEPIFELVPLNDDYPTITVNAGNPGRVVGTVVEHHRKLR